MSDVAPKGAYRSDPDHTSVLFRIKHLALAWYTGRFARASATLEFDADRIEASVLHAEVALGSVRMGYTGEDKDWDKELAEGDEFMDSLHEPRARFSSTRVERVGDGIVHVHGNLRFRRYERHFTFETLYNGAMLEDPHGGGGPPRVGFSAKGVMKRSEYGLVYGLGPRMPDDVQIIVESEFVLVD